MKGDAMIIFGFLGVFVIAIAAFIFFAMRQRA
jgi:hypothetical protein